MTEKRFIEASFPVKEVSEESAREKNIRHGHISTLHIWWARETSSCVSGRRLRSADTRTQK